VAWKIEDEELEIAVSFSFLLESYKQKTLRDELAMLSYNQDVTVQDQQYYTHPSLS
jgi:hypothetical protein